MKTWKHKIFFKKVVKTINDDGETLYLTQILGTNVDDPRSFADVDQLVSVRCAAKKELGAAFTVIYHFDHLKNDKEIVSLALQAEKFLQKYVAEDFKKMSN